MLEEGDESVTRAYQTTIADSDIDLALEYANSLDENPASDMRRLPACGPTAKFIA